MMEMPPTVLSDHVPDDELVQPPGGQSAPAAGLASLLAGFVRNLPDVSDVVAVSVDGVVIAASGGLPDHRVDQLGAITGSIASLSATAAWCVSGDQFRQTIVDMADSVLLVMTIPLPAHLAVVASPGCDLGQVRDAAATLCRRLSAVLMGDGAA